MNANQINKIKSKITKAQNHLDKCQQTLNELNCVLNHVTVSNTKNTPLINIGDYVISKTRPSKSKCEKVEGQTKHCLIVTPDNPAERPFRKAPQELANLNLSRRELNAIHN